jgi:hypothetical protein
MRQLTFCEAQISYQYRVLNNAVAGAVFATWGGGGWGGVRKELCVLSTVSRAECLFSWDCCLSKH